MDRGPCNAAKTALSHIWRWPWALPWFYVVTFGWIEHRRVVKGPWEIAFQSDAAGHPSLVVRQSTLGIAETIEFPAARVEPGLDQRLQFAEAVTNTPFGKVLFQDPTFLPGTLTFDFFGARVEFLPRVMAIDKSERAWERDGRIAVK